MDRIRTAASKLLVVIAVAMAGALRLHAQSSGHTIRHHKIAVEDPNAANLSQAEMAIQNKDFSSAFDLLNKVVAADPKNYEAWFDLGYVNNAQGKTSDAIAAYRQSVSAKPDVFESNLNLGLMLERAGQPGAEPFLRAATKLTPTAHAVESKEQAWLALGHALEKSSPAEAVEAFQEASQLQPNDVEPYLFAGPILQQQKRLPEAEQMYKRAMALDPQSADAVIGLANVYMTSHRFPEAQDALTKLLAIQPNNVNAHLELGRILAANGKPDEAIAELEIAEHAQPGDAALQREIADLLMSQKKYAQAESQYQLLVAKSPNDAELHASIGRALLYQKKFADAQQELLNALRMKPDMGPVYGDLAIAADQNQNYPLTIKALDFRAKFLPELPTTYFMRASAYDHLHDEKHAAENYHRFLEVANGKFPDQEWQAKHRLIAIEPRK